MYASPFVSHCMKKKVFTTLASRTDCTFFVQRWKLKNNSLPLPTLLPQCTTLLNQSCARSILICNKTCRRPCSMSPVHAPDYLLEGSVSLLVNERSSTISLNILSNFTTEFLPVATRRPADIRRMSGGQTIIDNLLVCKNPADIRTWVLGFVPRESAAGRSFG